MSDRARLDMGVALSAASKYLLKDDVAAGARALQILETWNERATLPTLYDLHVDFKAAKFDGITNDGYCGVRPWNMALDFGWMAYGLKDAAEVYAILKRNGYPLTAQNHANAQRLLRRMTAVVNSGLRAWTEWARLHPGGATANRYAADNHVGIYLSGVGAAAAALEDRAMIDYVVNGAAYDFGNGDNLPNYVPLKTYLERALVLDSTSDTVAWADIGWKDNYRTYHGLTQISLAYLFRVLDLNAPTEANLYDGFKTIAGHSAMDAARTYARYILGQLPGGKADVLAQQDVNSLEIAYAQVTDPAAREDFSKALNLPLRTGMVPRGQASLPHATAACIQGAD
jgi:hypothetical protein